MRLATAPTSRRRETARVAACAVLACAFGRGLDGANPTGELLMDASGAIFGATAGGGLYGKGAIFKLTPPAAGASEWTETILHSFTGGVGGYTPVGSLIADAGGALYGVASDAGGAYADNETGVIFQLAPPPAGSTRWTYRILHSFGDGSAGANPSAGLVRGENGALYGTLQAGAGLFGRGAAFRLTPPVAGQTQWRLLTLYRFKGGHDGWRPETSLTLGPDGTLYGATYVGDICNGAVFALKPSFPK